jgi:hypothetical protein
MLAAGGGRWRAPPRWATGLVDLTTARTSRVRGLPPRRRGPARRGASARRVCCPRRRPTRPAAQTVNPRARLWPGGKLRRGPWPRTDGGGSRSLDRRLCADPGARPRLPGRFLFAVGRDWQRGWGLASAIPPTWRWWRVGADRFNAPALAGPGERPRGVLVRCCPHRERRRPEWPRAGGAPSGWRRPELAGPGRVPRHSPRRGAFPRRFAATGGRGGIAESSPDGPARGRAAALAIVPGSGRFRGSATGAPSRLARSSATGGGRLTALRPASGGRCRRPPPEARGPLGEVRLSYRPHDHARSISTPTPAERAVQPTRAVVRGETTSGWVRA